MATDFLYRAAIGASAPGRDRCVLPGLVACDEDLGVYADEAVLRFGPGALGVLDLPGLGGGARPDAAELRAVATLYWCRSVEQAGLPRLVEALAGGLVEGRVHLDLSRAGAERLVRYYRRRSDRHTLSERQFRYSQLFGGPGSPTPNDAFAPAFQVLLRCLLDAARPALVPGARDRARVGAAVSALVGTLAGRVAGVTRFDADHIVAHVREAIDLLRHPDVAAALGGGPLLRLMEGLGPVLLRETLHPARDVARADAGATVLRWVSSVADQAATGLVDPAAAEQALAAAALLVEAA